MKKIDKRKLLPEQIKILEASELFKTRADFARAVGKNSQWFYYVIHQYKKPKYKNSPVISDELKTKITKVTGNKIKFN